MCGDLHSYSVSQFGMEWDSGLLWLMPSEEGYLEAEGLEKTWRIKQESIVCEVDIRSLKKAFDVVLPDFCPYISDYTLNGGYMVIAGCKGHLAIIDMKTMVFSKSSRLLVVRTMCFFQVQETVHDVVFFHSEEFFATAQKK
ncbi:hypothetical protein ACLOJK_005782 [Asimina triloba]